MAFLYGHIAKEGEAPTHTINGVDYVGAVLPDINAVWTDKEKYPFAAVLDWTKGGGWIGYALYLLDGIPCVVDGETTVLNVTTSTTYACTFDEESASEEGVQIAEWFFAGSHEPDDYGSPFPWLGDEMWVSHSVYYKSGKLVMEAIPPIPVYE